MTEESTSAARQREIIESWADANDHEIIGWAEDLDVSGSVDPFQAPALREWWDREGEWDILCAWKLDRIGRRAIPLNRVFGWMIDHNKTLVCVSDNIDLSTWVGRLVANVIAGVAEGELEAIRERTKASRRKLLEMGRWPGGSPPFGYTPEPIPGGGWRLAVDPAQAATVRSLMASVCAGEPVDTAASDHGMPTSTVWQILENKALLGHATYEGRTVRDREGRPVLAGDPILSQEDWDALQAALEARRQGKRMKNAGPMTGVIECFDCGQTMYHRNYRRSYGKQEYRYYYCPTHKDMVGAEMIENELEIAFLEAVGDEQAKERVYEPPENHQIELEEAVRAVDELSDLLGTITSTTMRSRLTEQMRALDARIAHLEALPTRPGGWIYRQTGQTFADKWQNSSQTERRTLLTQSGIRFRVKRIAGQAVQADLYTPAEAADLLNAKNPPTRR